MKALCTAVLATFLLGTVETSAQSYSQTNRSFVQSPMALGMGDAAVAFPSRATVFFYNPGHLAHIAPLRPRVTVLGIRGSFSENLLDQISFYKDTLDPAFDEGFENMDSDRVREIYDETLEIGRTRTLLGGDLLLPSVMFQAGGLGIGAGVFAHSLVRYRFPDGGAGVPAVDLTGMADLSAIASAALDLGRYGVSGLSIGATAKATQRSLTLKNKPLDAISGDEDVYVYKGSSLGLDVGILMDLDFIPIPGNLRFGAAVFDLVATDFAYEFDRNLTENAPDDQATIADEEATARELYEIDSSYRVGLAYTVPTFLGFFRETGVAVDYVGYSNPAVDQVMMTGLRIGVQANARIISLRAGLNSGYTTLGAGLSLGPVKVDYAYFAQEDGRLPGQLPSWTHTAQLALGF